MAVTVDAAALRQALRLGSTKLETDESVRLLAYATLTVVKYAPEAPDVVHNEATIRLCGFLFDKPYASRGTGLANALRSSGAASILLPFRIHRAGSTAEAIIEADLAVGTPGNPVTGVRVTGETLTVTFADFTTTDYALPSGGGTGEDPTARDAASAAQTTADDAATSAEEGIAAAAVNAAAIAAIPPPVGEDAAVWAEEGNVDQIPGAKLTLAPGGQRQVFVQTNQPSGSAHPFGALWIRDVTTAPVELHEWTGSQWRLDYTFPDLSTGEDQTARDAAAVAQTTADSKVSQTDFDTHAANPTAHHTPPSITIGGDVFSGFHLPGDEVAMRMGYSQTQVANAGNFTRADDHPIDGAAEGLSGGLAAPPFPPSLNTDSSLFFHIWFAGTPTLTDILDGSDTSYLDQIVDAGALTVEGVAGTAYVSTVRFNPLAPTEFRAIIPGEEIASEPWVDEQIAAIPGGGGGGTTARWYFTAHTNSPYTSGTAKALSLASFPIGPYADYAALRAAVIDETITQVVFRISQNDVGDADQDHGTVVTPNAELFRHAAGQWQLYPGHALSTDPVLFLFKFTATEITVTTDATFISGDPNVQVRVGVYA